MEYGVHGVWCNGVWCNGVWCTWSMVYMEYGVMEYGVHGVWCTWSMAVCLASLTYLAIFYYLSPLVTMFFQHFPSPPFLLLPWPPETIVIFFK